jgi:alkylation response protein AidB-like acyl-CoA dehydrogenase
MYNLHLSAEQLEIRDTVRHFVAREIKPVALKAERLDACDRRLPMELLDKASQMGLRTLALSEDLGGAGADHLTCCIVAEELAAGDADIAATLAKTSRLGHLLFDHAMTGAQRDRFLPRFLADDRYHLAFADHESETDTRLGVSYHSPVATESAMTTVAAKANSGEWIINGVKDCVANAPIAALFAVLVTIPGRLGASVLLVPADAPGLTVRTHEKPWRHGPCGDVTFKDCRVPASYLLGEEAAVLLSGPDRPGRGVPLFQALNLGVGRAAYEAALDYAQLRVQGGRPIIEHQAIGTKLAEIAIKLEVARAIIWQAAWASDHPTASADRSLSDLPLQTVAHVFTSEMMLKAAKDAAEIFGAMGVMRDMPMQKYVHDALVCLHSGDGNSDAKLRIAEVLAGYRRAADSAMAIAGV